MNRQALDRVLEEIGKNVAELQKSQRCGGVSGFKLKLWNSVTIGDNTETVSIYAYTVDPIRSQAPTVEEGLGDVLTQLLTKLGQHLKHRCSICLKTHEGFDLSTVPVGAFGELMWEVAEIGIEMSQCKNAGVGRHEGPRFNVELSTIGPPRAQLYFVGLERRYGEFGRSDYIFFKSSGKNVLDALEEVIAQARDHLRKKRSHRCPICNLFHSS